MDMVILDNPRGSSAVPSALGGFICGSDLDPVACTVQSVAVALNVVIVNIDVQSWAPGQNTGFVKPLNAGVGDRYSMWACSSGTFQQDAVVVIRTRRLILGKVIPRQRHNTVWIVRISIPDIHDLNPVNDGGAVPYCDSGVGVYTFIPVICGNIPHFPAIYGKILNDDFSAGVCSGIHYRINQLALQVLPIAWDEGGRIRRFNDGCIHARAFQRNIMRNGELLTESAGVDSNRIAVYSCINGCLNGRIVGDCTVMIQVGNVGSSLSPVYGDGVIFHRTVWGTDLDVGGCHSTGYQFKCGAAGYFAGLIVEQRIQLKPMAVIGLDNILQTKRCSFIRHEECPVNSCSRRQSVPASRGVVCLSKHTRQARIAQFA